ncbi:MAG: NUDIX domain-containing protein [Bacteroidota bacterium]
MFRAFLIKLIGKVVPLDRFAPKYPVSVKGIIVHQGKIVLLKNDREEWELPGGKLDPGEQPHLCVAREIQEELRLEVTVAELVDVWVYDIQGKVKVFMVAFWCVLQESSLPHLEISHEHKEVGWFTPDELPDIPLPTGYQIAIKKGLARFTSP